MQRVVLQSISMSSHSARLYTHCSKCRLTGPAFRERASQILWLRVGLSNQHSKLGSLNIEFCKSQGLRVPLALVA